MSRATYCFVCPSTDIFDESVFAFILIGNLVNFKRTRVGKSLITLYGFCALLAYPYSVWSIVYLFLGLPEPPIDKRNASHLFCFLYCAKILHTNYITLRTLITLNHENSRYPIISRIIIIPFDILFVVWTRTPKSVFGS